MSKSLAASELQRALDDFIAFIRIPSVSGNGPLDGSYDACGAFLLERMIELGLEAQVLPESKPHKPVVVGTLRGTDPDLPCLLLNSHYDVVPIIEDKWTVPAFEGLRKDGKIYGRGTQDMKSVCIQYLAAIRHLQAAGHTFRRTVHLSFVPDEETGGADGMGVLLASQWYTSIGEIALALDEGLASEDDAIPAFYGERNPWWIRVKATGNTGHGSRFIEGTAVEMVLQIANRAMAFRKEQKDLLHGGLHAGCSHSVAKKTLGDVTSLNLTVLRAGLQAGGHDVLNVVPATAEAAFDVRISPHTPMEEIKKMFDDWCNEANSTPGLPEGGGVTWDFVYEPLYQHNVTALDDSNPWWQLFKNTVEGKCGIALVPSVFPAATDSRFLRAKGIRAIGFSPMRKSKVLLHEHDEHIEEKVFEEGCNVFVDVVAALSSQGPF